MKLHQTPEQVQQAMRQASERSAEIVKISQHKPAQFQEPQKQEATLTPTTKSLPPKLRSMLIG